MTLGEKIKELRIKNNLSQEELANKLGVTRQAVSKREQNLALPDTNNLILISKIFNVKIDELINYNNNLNEQNINADINDNDTSDDKESKLDANTIKENENIKNTPIYNMLSSLTILICLVTFILAGMYAKNGWLLFLSIPIYYLITEAIDKNAIFKKKK